MSQGDPPAEGRVFQQGMKCLWSTKFGASVDRILASPQGVAAVVNENTIFIIDCSGPITIKQELKGHSAGITTATFSAKGTEIIAGGQDGFLKWWQVDNGEETCSTQFPYYHSDEQTEPVSNGVGPLAISALACSKGQNLVAAASGRFVCIFGPGGEHLHTITSHPEAVTQLVWSTDSKLAVACGARVHTWTVSQSQYHKSAVYTAKPKGAVSTLCSSPDGKYLAAACGASTIQVWLAARESESGNSSSDILPLHVFAEFGDSEIKCLTWDASSRFFASAFGGDVFVWDLQDVSSNRKENIVCLGHDVGRVVTSVAFQQSGALMVTAADNGKLLVYDSASFAQIGVVSSLVGAVTSAQVSDLPGPCHVSVTWHASGFIVAATQSGDVVFFQPSALEPQRLASGIEEMFQVRHDGQPARRRGNSRQPAGWGGEPLLTPEAQSGDQQPSGFGNRAKSRQAAPTNGISPPQNRKGMRPTRAKPANAPSSASASQPLPATFRRETVTTPPPMEQQQMMPGWGMMPQVGGGAMRWPTMHMPYMPYAQPGKQGMPGQIPTMVAPSTPAMSPYMQQAHMQAAPVQGMGPRPPPGTPMQMPMPVYMYQPNPQWPMAYMQQWPYFTYYPFQAQPGQQSPQQMPHPQMMQQAGPAPMPMLPGPSPQPHPPQHSSHNHSDDRHAAPTRRSSSSSVDKEASTSARAPPSDRSESSSFILDDRAKAIQTLYVGNLPQTVDENALYSQFIHFGYIASVQVIRDKSTGHSRGFGFVTYAYPASATVAMHSMNGVSPNHPAFQGRTVKVSPSNRC